MSPKDRAIRQCFRPLPAYSASPTRLRQRPTCRTGGLFRAVFYPTCRRPLRLVPRSEPLSPTSQVFEEYPRDALQLADRAGATPVMAARSCKLFSSSLSPSVLRVGPPDQRRHTWCRSAQDCEHCSAIHVLTIFWRHISRDATDVCVALSRQRKRRDKAVFAV